MATNENNKRITYPLSVKEVEELQSLEAQMKSKAEAAQKANRVGLHRSYIELMKSTNRVVTRERNRMGREALARYNKAQKELQKLAKNAPVSQTETSDEGIA